MIRIFLDPAGKILEAEPRLGEGLNAPGSIHGVAAPSFELHSAPSPDTLQDFPPTQIDSSGPLIFVRKNVVEWAAPDITASRDLFYCKTRRGAWLLGDDFFRIAEEFPQLTLAPGILQYFISHGYLPPGKTFFQEIARARPGMRLVFRKGAIEEEDAWPEHEEGERTYEAFKLAFSSVFEAYPFRETAGISLSAGPDSGLVAAVAALKQGRRPIAFTIVTPNQPLAINDVDEAVAWRIARHLGLEHVAVEFDYNKHHVSEFEKIVEAMPLAAHLSLHFFKLGEEARRRGRTQVWYGQSADSVYNLGPTQKSWGGPLRRFYLTKEYWQGFPDITGNTLVGSAARALGIMGPLVWRWKHGQLLRQPSSFRELVDAFANAEGTPPFPPRYDKSHDREKYTMRRKRLTTREAREELFAWKLQAFLTGKDARVLYALGDRYGLETVLPYTASNMLQFFRGLEMGLRDVFLPKRFIYRYLEELLGKAAFKELYAGQERHVPALSPLSWRQWQKRVLSNTVLGQEMREVALQGAWETDPLNFQHALSCVWLHCVISKIESGGRVVLPGP